MLGSQQEAKAWLERPAIGLNQRRTIDLLAMPAGAEIVETFLKRIEYGVYTWCCFLPLRSGRVGGVASDPGIGGQSDVSFRPKVVLQKPWLRGHNAPKSAVRGKRCLVQKRRLIKVVVTDAGLLVRRTLQL